MLINPRMIRVMGHFDTQTDRLICVPNRKYFSVDLCLEGPIYVPFAEIRLYDRDRRSDAEATFEDASRLGNEIANRWNQVQEAIKNGQQNL